jgi:hypothetical protein
MARAEIEPLTTSSFGGKEGSCPTWWYLNSLILDSRWKYPMIFRLMIFSTGLPVWLQVENHRSSAPGKELLWI